MIYKREAISFPFIYTYHFNDVFRGQTGYLRGHDHYLFLCAPFLRGNVLCDCCTCGYHFCNGFLLLRWLVCCIRKPVLRNVNGNSHGAGMVWEN